MKSFHSSPKGSTLEKPKFECGNLEDQNSGNHLKEIPEVLSRLGQEAGSNEI